MYIWDIGQVRVRVESTVSTAYQETYLGVLEGLLCRWGLADAHHERKDTDNRGSRPSSNNTREDSTHGRHQMANTEIRLIIFFAAKEGEALYSQQKQDRELSVAQIINLLPNSDLN